MIKMIVCGAVAELIRNGDGRDATKHYFAPRL